MVVDRNNGVVGLTGFSDKKMSGHLFAPKKSGRNNAVGVPLYALYRRVGQNPGNEVVADTAITPATNYCDVA